MAKSGPADEKIESIDDAYAADAVACARALATWAQNALRLLEHPGFRPAGPQDPEPERFRVRAEAVRRAWVAANVNTAEPTNAAWREFIRATIRTHSWPFDEYPADGWPDDPDQRVIERGRREIHLVARLRQRIASVNPGFEARLSNDADLLDALRAHFNRGGAGKRAGVTKQVALAKLDKILGIRAKSAARTARRRLKPKGRASMSSA